MCVCVCVLVSGVQGVRECVLVSGLQGEKVCVIVYRVRERVLVRAG